MAAGVAKEVMGDRQGFGEKGKLPSPPHILKVYAKAAFRYILSSWSPVKVAWEGIN